MRESFRALSTRELEPRSLTNAIELNLWTSEEEGTVAFEQASPWRGSRRSTSSCYCGPAALTSSLTSCANRSKLALNIAANLAAEAS